jgi:hypothetical protein
LCWRKNAEEGGGGGGGPPPTPVRAIAKNAFIYLSMQVLKYINMWIPEYLHTQVFALKNRCILSVQRRTNIYQLKLFT